MVHQMCRVFLFIVSEELQCVEYLQSVYVFNGLVRSVQSEDCDLTCFEHPMFLQPVSSIVIFSL